MKHNSITLDQNRLKSLNTHSVKSRCTVKKNRMLMNHLFKNIPYMLFTPLKHTLTGREEKTLMKLIVDRVSDRVVGLHMVGPDAGEIAQGFAVAIKAGATKADFDATIGIHPTAAEEYVTMRDPVPDEEHAEAVE